LIIKEITNHDLIKSILCHPDIYKCIYHGDEISAEDREIEDGPQYIAGFVDGAIIGIVIYHICNGYIKSHIQVLPEYRKEHAIRFARMALNFGRAKNATVYAEIPERFPNVVSFAKRVGFTELGIKEGKYILRRDNGIF